MNLAARFLTLAFAAVLLASCRTSTLPTAADMDKFYQKAGEMVQYRIEELDGKKRRGEITPEEYETQVRVVRSRIADNAMQLAWARHENVEAQNRALGIPTGDKPVEVKVPGVGAGESFYRRAGEVSGSSRYNTAPFGGSVLGGPNRGDRPELPPVQPPGGQLPPEPSPCP